MDKRLSLAQEERAPDSHEFPYLGASRSDVARNCGLPESLGLPLIKCACLLRQRWYVSDTFSSMSWYALFLWKEELTDELCRHESTCLLFCFTGEHGHYIGPSDCTDPDHRPRLL